MTVQTSALAQNAEFDYRSLSNSSNGVPVGSAAVQAEPRFRSQPQQQANSQTRQADPVYQTEQRYPAQRSVQQTLSNRRTRPISAPQDQRTQQQAPIGSSGQKQSIIWHHRGAYDSGHAQAVGSTDFSAAASVSVDSEFVQSSTEPAALGPASFYEETEIDTPRFRFHRPSFLPTTSSNWAGTRLAGLFNDDCSQCDDENADSVDCPPICCPVFWEHRHSIWGEFWYLQARNADINYATHVDGTINSFVPLAPSNVANPNYQPGFRVGFNYALDFKSSITGAFSYYESDTHDSVALAGGTGFLFPQLVHPTTLVTVTDRLSGDITHDIDFQFGELNYKSILRYGDYYALNWVIGVRYVNLDQDLNTVYTSGDVIRVNSEIDFDGIGPRIGLEGERSLGRRGMLVYAKGAANFIVGEFTADYRQNNVTTAVQQARAGMEDDRIVTQLELELGVGWERQCCDRIWRLTAGYYVSSWINTLTTSAFIQGVQANDLDDMHETLTFDGLTVRMEIRY
jgi:hypothetical protein